MHHDIQYSWSYIDQSKKDVNISEEEIKAECQYVIFSIYSAVGCPVYGIYRISPFQSNW